MSRIRECFPSRWGDDGFLVEADYAQLEIVALATLSRDEQLIDDLLSGEDLHKLRASQWLKKPVSEIDDQERFNAKRLSFMLQYGSGAKNMSYKLNLPKAECQEFIDAFNERYPDVVRFQERVYESVITTRTVDGTTPSGMPRGVGKYKSITGRIYTFYEYDNFRGDDTSFSPTELKNYPVQGFATGDIMKIASGILGTYFWSNSAVKLCNTVHDSFMFDCHGVADLSSIIDTIADIMERQTTDKLASQFGIKLAVPLKADFKVSNIGGNWNEMKEIS